MIRAFIAIELNEEVRRALSDLQRGLKKELAAVRWVRPAGIHLTLKFLGDIPEEAVDAIGAALATATRGQGALNLSVKGLGVFPSIRKARVIWAGLGGETAALFDLQRVVDAALEAVGFPREGRRFKAHLTLGRFKKAPLTHELAKVIEDRSAFPPVAMPVDAVVLYRSELRPQGARYTTLSRVTLV